MTWAKRRQLWAKLQIPVWSFCWWIQVSTCSSFMHSEKFSWVLTLFFLESLVKPGLLEAEEKGLSHPLAFRCDWLYISSFLWAPHKQLYRGRGQAFSQQKSQCGQDQQAPPWMPKNPSCRQFPGWHWSHKGVNGHRENVKFFHGWNQSHLPGERCPEWTGAGTSVWYLEVIPGYIERRKRPLAESRVSRQKKNNTHKVMWFPSLIHLTKIWESKYFYGTRGQNMKAYWTSDWTNIESFLCAEHECLVFHRCSLFSF